MTDRRSAPSSTNTSSPRSSPYSCRSRSTPRIRSPTSPGLSLNLAVRIRNARTGRQEFARLKVPPMLPALRAAADLDGETVAIPPAGRPHRQPPRRPLPGHGDPRPPHVPPDPQRGRGDRGGRDREPHPGARSRTAAPSFRAADPPRGRRRHGRRHARPAHQRARHHRAGGLPPSRTARPPRPVRSRARSTVPNCTIPLTCPRPRSRSSRPSRTGVPTSSRRSARATCWCTTRTSRSPRASALPRAGRARPARARHQADALSHLGRQPDRAGAHRRGRVGQAGARPRRGEGALRRGRQHRVGAQAREGRACTSSTDWSGLKTHCKLALVIREEDGVLRQLQPRRHRQLQPEDQPHLRGLRPLHRRRPGRDATSPGSSTSCRATRSRRSSSGCSSPRCTCARACCG